MYMGHERGKELFHRQKLIIWQNRTKEGRFPVIEKGPCWGHFLSGFVRQACLLRLARVRINGGNRGSWDRGESKTTCNVESSTKQMTCCDGRRWLARGQDQSCR